MKDLIAIQGNRVVAVTPVTTENLEFNRQYFAKKGMIAIQGIAKIGDHYDPKTGKFSTSNDPGMLTINGFYTPPVNWKISKLAFKNRFPRDKWIASKKAAISDEELEDFFESFDLAQFIDLSSEYTIESVNVFKTDRVPAECRLTEEEVNSILTTPPLINEVA